MIGSGAPPNDSVKMPWCISAVGTVSTVVNPSSMLLPWKPAKKNVLFLLIGPPSEPP